MRASYLVTALFALAAPSELLRRLPDEVGQGRPPELIGSPAQMPQERICSTTLGIVKPCITSSKNSTRSGSTRKPSSTLLTSTSKTPPRTSTSATLTPTTTASADRLKACFSPSGTCEPMFTKITSFWNKLPENTPPWQDNRTFPFLFCGRHEQVSRDTLMTMCRRCSDVDARTRDVWNTFKSAVKDFCTVQKPNVYTLSKAVLAFVEDMVADPLGFEPSGLNPRVEKLVGQWQDMGANQSTAVTGAVPTADTATIPATVLMKGLSQLPRAWPYTRAAVARVPGQTATFTVTKALQAGAAEYVVVESIVWNPRPLDFFGVFQNFSQSIIGYDAYTSSGSISSTLAGPSLLDTATARRPSSSLGTASSTSGSATSLKSKGGDGVPRSSVSMPTSTTLPLPTSMSKNVNDSVRTTSLRVT